MMSWLECLSRQLPAWSVKLMARSAPSMIQALNEIWGAIRGALWHMPPAILRKY